MRSVPANYLEAVPNPFNLVGPPAWFRRQMAAQDADLVIFPSQEEGLYRVARRVRANHQPVMHALQNRPDTKIYVQHGLVPVISLAPFVQWGPVVLSDLAEMDMWRFGGADAVADELEQRERIADEKLDLDIADQAMQLAGESFRGLKWRNGSAVDLGARAGRRTRATEVRRQPAYRPLDFAGGSAAFIGR